MRLIQAENYREMSRIAGSIIEEQLRNKKDTVLGLATGSSPLGIYEQLSNACKERNLCMSRVIGFNLDEYKGLERTHPQSFYYYLKKNLIEKTDFMEEHLHVIDGTAEDIASACRKYEEEIRESGGIDLQILGLGETGHVGFNEPDGCFSKETCCVKLEAQTIEANSRFFEQREDVPDFALTLGIGTIMKARRIVMVVSGASKAKILEKMIYGEVTPQIPASILQFHRDVTVVADREACSEINGRVKAAEYK